MICCNDQLQDISVTLHRVELLLEWQLPLGLPLEECCSVWKEVLHSGTKPLLGERFVSLACNYQLVCIVTFSIAIYIFTSTAELSLPIVTAVLFLLCHLLSELADLYQSWRYLWTHKARLPRSCRLWHLHICKISHAVTVVIS